jgi:hypothetical protein
MSVCRNIKSCDIFIWENTIPGGISHQCYVPNTYIRISKDNIEKKLLALKEHHSQMVKYDNLYEYIINKAKMFGYYCDSDYCETFYQIKKVI